jgi:undecaprenyl-diphosphatase
MTSRQEGWVLAMSIRTSMPSCFAALTASVGRPGAEPSRQARNVARGGATIRPVRTLTSRISVPLALLAIACAAGFLALATVVSRQGSVGLDEPVTAFVSGLGISPEIWRAMTNLGGFVLVPVGVGLVMWLLWQRRPGDAVVVAVALVGATLFTDAVKDLVARPRPPDPVLGPATGFSFPSGHTLNSTVTYGLVALYAWRSHLPLTARRVTIAVLAAIPFLVGLSRIALGVHYPSDVLGGWLAGMAIVFTVGAITRPATTALLETARAGP